MLKKISRFLSIPAVLCLGLYSCTNQNSSQYIWLSFTEENSDLYGFTDINGRVVIEPQFTGGFSAKIFKNIVAVKTIDNGIPQEYYLLKNGQQIGKDSVYSVDLKYDCEHEGYIRFRDPNTYFTGLMDSTGRIIIAPDYNDLSQAHNGFLLATLNAQKVIRSQSEGQDIAWVGGQTSLINLQGKTIIDTIIHAENLNLHSLKILKSAPENTDTTTTYRGTDERFYSFIDNKKSFLAFYLSVKNDLKNALDEHLIVWNNNQWMDMSAEDFLNVHSQTMKDFEDYISDSTNVVFLNVQNFLPLTEKREKEFEQFRDDCDNWNTMSYPIYEISYIKNEDDLQTLYCMKTEKGFKILAIKFYTPDSQL